VAQRQKPATPSRQGRVCGERLVRPVRRGHAAREPLLLGPEMIAEKPLAGLPILAPENSVAKHRGGRALDSAPNRLFDV
jgi:hypothetical protein